MELRGFAELPADTFAGRPPSGQYDENGNLLPEPRFEAQPVQGFSGVQFADQDSYWFLSDNGFGTKLNSQDYLLRLYRVDSNFRGEDGGDGSVNVIDFIQFSDPDNKAPFSIKNEDTSDRLLTGFDFDVESFVIAADGTFWVGEEFGPFLLHFDATGKLLEAPIPTPNNGTNPSEDFVRSPQNPAILDQPEQANLARSNGYEGLAINPDKTKLYALLEGTVAGDPEDALRIYEFDLASKQFTGIKGLYRKESPDHPIGDFTVINENEYLVIERDNFSGDAAEFKKIFKIDLSKQDANGYVTKEEVVDLLNISDPQDLNRDSSTNFRFPFITIEDVLVIDKDTILVANDNNYPGTGGRSATESDQNEILLLDLDKPLNLDPRVGLDALEGNELRFGTPGDDQLFATQKDILFGGAGDDILDASTGLGKNRLYGGTGDDELFAGSRDRLFGGDGNDILDASVGKGSNRLYGGTGNDTLFGGSRDFLFGGNGDDQLFVGEGDTLTGGDGRDQFWIAAGEIPTTANTITDFQSDTDVIGLGAGLAFANLAITQAGNDTTINLKDGSLLATLTGVESSTISIADFVSTAPRPLIIGHRGASGLRPEHTLASYELAIEQGADFIEPDVVSTKDGMLIARHEVNIKDTTDVADHPEFSDRFTTKIIDGTPEEGWFADDFTLAEIKTLRAEERLEFRDQSFNGEFEIPTLQEIIDLAKAKSTETGRTIGIYPETKHPTYHDSVGLSLEEPLVDILKANGYNQEDSPVFIQSFEVGNLKELNTLIDVPLVQLLNAADIALNGEIIENQPYDFVVSGDDRTYGDLRTPEGLAEIAEYADGIGPWKRMIVSVESVDADGDGLADDITGDDLVNDNDKSLTDPTSLIDDAHAAGLLVHAYTFRNEDIFLAQDYNGNPELEYEQFFSLGLDGLFTDFPGTGFEVASRLYPFTNPDPLLSTVLPSDTVVG